MKSVYTGGEKVAEFESYDELRVGDGKPAFIYEGNELVYPNPVKDGLVLWYDFSGRTNADGQHGVAEDLSGNGNHGTLQNFNFTAESGYDKNKLLFDGVDDGITSKSGVDWGNQSKITVEVTLKSLNTSNVTVVSNDYRNFEISIQSGGGIQAYYSNGSGQNYKQPAAAATLNDGNIHFIAVVFHKDESLVIFYEDGKEIHRYQEPTVIDLSGQIFADFCVGQRPPNSTRKFPGVIYSTKIYNRPLTPEEIAHNYAIEKERFGIE